MRLFVAVNFPAAERARLGSVLEELAQTPLPFRWVPPDSLGGARPFERVESIDLMRSHTGASGARYERVAAATFEKQ